MQRVSALASSLASQSFCTPVVSGHRLRSVLVRMLSHKIDIGGLKVDEHLVNLVKDEIAPGTGVDVTAFWASLGKAVKEIGPRNKALLEKRDQIQSKIDAWHRERKGKPIEMSEYKAFLTSIGYLVPQGPAFQVSTAKVDAELAVTAGPQLVCPVDNARFILNAANARWGSLLDALYGTDVISEEGGATRGTSYNAVRGAKVFDEVHRILNEFFPLTQGSYADATEFSVKDGKLRVSFGSQEVGLKSPEKFVGYQAAPTGGAVSSILLRNNGLHFDIRIDPSSAIGRTHKAGVKDVVMEAALTAIADCEDSVAAVDGPDKATCYRNWFGLMKGSLTAKMSKDGKPATRAMNEDITWKTPAGGSLTLPGRVVLLVRNVGIHLYTDAVTTADGQPIPENFLDAMVTSLAAVHDVKRPAGGPRNSRAGSVYIVRPKMHGPEEVAMVDALFAHAEDSLGLPRYTLKVGIMDEERRTSINLGECVRACKDRVVFINTGFLDRTGDEIHTSFEAGPFLPKDEIKKQVWIKAYEDNNVDVGLACGLAPGHGQIGKGMWAAPDNMAQMLREKIAHPNAGANTAWVPSPTAATLHALHYHRVNVAARQAELRGRTPAKVEDILTVPLLPAGRKLSGEEVQKELDNNAQGILGYVVRWIGQGIGCSKVPDIHDVQGSEQLMEDRATLRISSQLVANWLHHGICTLPQVEETMHRMAVVVDRQNAGDPNYRPMAPGYDSIEFQAAMDLIKMGRTVPNGYTEFTLTERRKRFKAAEAARSGKPKL